MGSASSEAAISQLESVGHLWRQNGVNRKLEDIASDMDTGVWSMVVKLRRNFRKLGLDMDNVKTDESLLSFEDSINGIDGKSMLTGRMINTDKGLRLVI